MKIKNKYDVVVIGGGFYGCLIALFLRKKFKKVAIFEKDNNLLKRASFVNQARIHNGYHYPRSYITALRSRINFPKFVKEFPTAIYKDFTKIYAIAKNNSKVNSDQFFNFCKRINAPIKTAPEKIKALFNADLIENSFIVKEYAFDSNQLRKTIINKIKKTDISLFFKTQVLKIGPDNDKGLLVHISSNKTIKAKIVFNCTYSNINSILKNSGLPLIDFKQELTEIAIIDVADELKKYGITVMDGSFFSFMPFPALKHHSLSHVGYTPHTYWRDTEEYQNPEKFLKYKIKSNYPFMIRDAVRYIPALSSTQHLSSLYEIKTLLSKNEVDDGRPILFKKDYGFKNHYVVLGGKIDNIFDVLHVLSSTFK